MCRESFCKQGEQPPCSECEQARPFLLPENVEVYRLWKFCNSQLLTSFGAVIGIDYNAMYKVAGTLCMEITPAILSKIRALEEVMVKEASKHGK